jgi:DNA polymerase elongation subunit (family B)
MTIPKIQNILFLDIETVPQYKSFDEVPEDIKIHWLKKEKQIKAITPEEENLYNRAGIYAEFGKIVCISCGYIVKYNSQWQIRMKSFYGDDEVEILRGFKNLIKLHFNKKEHVLCAHNGKEFDFPYIARRILINKLSLPNPLQLAGKKPWEVKHLDTLELWKFGDYKHYTSLDLLTAIFGIKSPKSDITGADVAKVYWQEKDVERIVKYCVQDVVALIQLYLSYNNLEHIKDENIIVID